jgi:hypothetical protein
MNQLSIPHFSTAYLRTRLQHLGYLVTVEVENRPTKHYKQAYSVKFFEGLPVSEEFCWQIAGNFPGFSRHISPTRIFLPTSCWQEILPDFPSPNFVMEEEQEQEEALIVNTKMEAQVNTLQEEIKALSASRQWLQLSKQEGYQERVSALIKELEHPEKVLSIEERALLENYVSRQTAYYNRSSLRDYPLQRYVPAETMERIAGTMYQIAYSLGFSREGTVLNPCCGTGRFIKAAPHQERVTAIEWHPTEAIITRKLYPLATLHSMEFEKIFLAPPSYDKLLTEPVTWLKEYPFDLVIGALPSGRYSSSYTCSKTLSKLMTGYKLERAEHFYLYYLSKLLKPGGLFIVLMSSYWMGSEPSKIDFSLARNLHFAGAYRVASGFSGLDLQSEIMVFQAKEPNEH